jgi:hypothetical protein
MIRVWLTALALVAIACSPRVVELGTPDAAAPRDAPVDAPVSTCRCRITPCRVSGDCALTGGVCGTDLYCVGDFGACTTSSQCQATFTASQCTQGTTSIAPCP